MPDIRAIRVLCPVCDCLLSVLIDGGDAHSLRIPDGAIAAGVREHVDLAHPERCPTTTGPEVGATVHYLQVAAGNLYCLPASVGGIQENGTLNLDMPPGTPDRMFADAVAEDRSARTASTWHYPCETTKPLPTPEPDAPPITVTINVHGVLAESQLADLVRDQMLKLMKRDPTTYAPYKR